MIDIDNARARHAFRVSGRRCSLLLIVCLVVAGCPKALSPAEKEFYGRVARVEAGHAIEDVKRQLGEPTRIVDAAPPCSELGGSKSWVYESFETPAGREALQGASVLIRVNQAVVVARFTVYQ
jgi:hypothetical protein